MKKKSGLSIVLVSVMVLVFLAGFVQAEDKMATPAQAKEQVKKMVAYVKEVGCEKAIAQFNDPKSAWNATYANVYSSVGDWSGVTLANGLYPVLAGQNHMDLKDAKGKLFIKEAIEKCKKNGRAQEEFMWLITKTNKIEPRTLAVEVVDCSGKKVDVGITYSGKL